MNPFVATKRSEATETRSVKRIRSGTEQQEALWSALVDGRQSVLVEARAGSGKSASCREGMWRILDRHPDTSIRYAVFNTQNAREFAADCPEGVDVATVHSFGYKALQKCAGSKLEKNKTYLILDENREGRSMPRYFRKAVAMIVAHGKNQNLDPHHPGAAEQLRILALHYDVKVYGRSAWVVSHALEVLRRSLEWTELIDFDDMIWLPAQLGIPFPDCDLLFLDEVQDWNPAQLALIPLLTRGRVVAVGDRYQSIYGFRGADTESIPNLQAQLSRRPEGLAEMPLTITWRCPVSHVDLARQYVSDIQAHPSAIPGELSTTPAHKARYLPGDMVLCAANAPLVRAALNLIGSRQPAIVRGRSIGDSLVQILRGLEGCRTMPELMKGIETWKGRELSRLSELDGVEDLMESVEDRASGLAAVCQSCDSPAQVEGAIASLFSDSASVGGMPGYVVFSTIHRAKGLEAERVHWIQAPMQEPKADWEVQHRSNLSYVALTRSKRFLSFVTTESSHE